MEKASPQPSFSILRVCIPPSANSPLTKLDAKPTGDVETAVHAEVSKVLSLGQETLQNVKNYKGCDEQIRKVP